MNRSRRQLVSALVCLVFLPFTAVHSSGVVSDVVFDWATHRSLAPGSDNFPITWADDDNQYTSWGDGGGFGGTNSDGRVSLGVARVEGDADGYEGVNVYGSEGKSYGILSLDGTLYLWVMREGQYFKEAKLRWSANRGATWTKADWSFANLNSAFSVPTLLNFGKDYAGARDGYVYLYAPGEKSLSSLFNSADVIDLARVPKAQITNRNAYEFFSGLDGSGNATWTANINQRQPVLSDPGQVHWTIGVSYSPGLDRYFLFNNSRANPSQNSSVSTDLDIYEAVEPWGPWTLVKSFPNWNNIGYTFSYYLAPKWISPDGRDFTLVFSGTGANDSWNTVQGSFVSSDTDSMPPAPPEALRTD
jgi:hypothetical protein